MKDLVTKLRAAGITVHSFLEQEDNLDGEVRLDNGYTLQVGNGYTVLNWSNDSKVDEEWCMVHVADNPTFAQIRYIVSMSFEDREHIEAIREERKDCECEPHPYCYAPIDGMIGERMCWKCSLKYPKNY